MTLAERLAQIEAAALQPGGLALRTVEQITHGQSDLLRTLECASITHAWDHSVLKGLLDPDLMPDSQQWHDRLVELPMVESYLSRPGWHNVHEVTRKALRDRLHSQNRLQALSARALAVLSSSLPNSSGEVLERLYLQLLAEPSQGAEALENQWQKWSDQGRWEALQDLAGILEELLPHLESVARARALLCCAIVRENRRPIHEISAQVDEAAKLFARIGYKRGLSDAASLAGRLAEARGDLVTALAKYTESRKIMERLEADDPASIEWKRDLAGLSNNLGNVAETRGDLAAAQAHYLEGKSINEQLAADDLTNAQWQRNLSASLNNLGNVAEARGDLATAQAHYTEAWRIMKQLVTGDPANTRLLRDLSVSLNRLGRMAETRGDLVTAHAYFTEGRNIMERLVAGDSANAEWQHALAISLNHLGRTAEVRGDLTEALEYYNEDKIIAEKLAASDPENTQWQHALSVSLNNLGRMAEERGDLTEALKYFNEDKRIAEKLAESDPDNALWQRDLVATCISLGDLCLKNKQAARARNHHCQAYDILCSMKKQGRHLSPHYCKMLEWLRKKVAKR